MIGTVIQCLGFCFPVSEMIMMFSSLDNTQFDFSPNHIHVIKHLSLFSVNTVIIILYRGVI